MTIPAKNIMPMIGFGVRKRYQRIERNGKHRAMVKKKTVMKMRMVPDQVQETKVYLQCQASWN